MDLGIVGLARSGKTTVFHALTHGHASTATYGAVEPNIGVVKVPDERLDQLCPLYNPRKVTHAEVRFLDFPGGLSLKGESPEAALLAALSQCDALVHVVRAFHNEAVPHPDGAVDPGRDVAAVDLELAFADAAMLERRQERLQMTVRSARAGERDAGEREMALLTRLRAALEGEQPLRAQELSPDERRMISGYQLLTNKPLLIVANIDEGDATRAGEIGSEFASRWAGPGLAVVAICGKLERELAELPEEEAAEFRRELGVGAEATGELLRRAQDVLGLITFFTVGEPEGRAWPVSAGTTALEAAGKIHSDIARGFIRAEVIGWQELLASRTLAEARKRGDLRTEGKSYVVQDGDVLHVLFNV